MNHDSFLSIDGANIQSMMQAYLRPQSSEAIQIDSARIFGNSVNDKQRESGLTNK